MIEGDRLIPIIDEYDSKTGYCRMLGHHLDFNYCRSVKDGLPCFKIIDCWFEHIPIQEFIKKHFSEEKIKEILTPPKSKIDSIVEIITKARKNKD